MECDPHPQLVILNSAKVADLHQLKQRDQLTFTDGSQPGDTITVSVNSNSSSYTVQDGDTPDSSGWLPDGLPSDPQVSGVVSATKSDGGVIVLEALDYGAQGYVLESSADTPGTVIQDQTLQATTDAIPPAMRLPGQIQHSCRGVLPQQRPGARKRNSISPEDGSFDSIEEATAEIEIDITHLEVGTHTLGLRLRDELGQWSATRIHNIVVYDSAKEADLHQLKQQDQVTITDGVQTGDTVTVSVNSNNSSYTVEAGDSVNTIQFALLALLTSNPVINTVANVTAGATGELLLEALKYGDRATTWRHSAILQIQSFRKPFRPEPMQYLPQTTSSINIT